MSPPMLTQLIRKIRTQPEVRLTHGQVPSTHVDGRTAGWDQLHFEIED